jgi:DNA-binding NarL/FixJ family response regulator
MGLNFRRTLISKLERREREIDFTLALLRRLQVAGPDSAGEFRRLATVGGFEKRSSPRIPPLSGTARYKEIQDLREQGLSLRAIGEHVQLSHAGVWKALRRLAQEQTGAPNLEQHAGEPPRPGI